jgi:hypothetical protein
VLEQLEGDRVAANHALGMKVVIGPELSVPVLQNLNVLDLVNDAT